MGLLTHICPRDRINMYCKYYFLTVFIVGPTLWITGLMKRNDNNDND